jgi:ammonium transporter Rh
VGESIYVHVFGAYFGLAVSRVLQSKKVIESSKESSHYHSDMFSMIGTIFLWLYWPSFNSATAKEEGQVRAIVNTYLSITASCVCTFIVSLLVGKGRLNMVHIQNATLAGGVAVGAVADMPIQPFGAMIIGSFAGVISTLGFQYLTPMLNHGILHDTCKAF